MSSIPLATLDARPAVVTDDELVARVRAGELSAFEPLMRRYNRRLYRVARAILRDDAEAEDAVQHGYFMAYAELHSFEGRAAFSTWLTRIVVNHALLRLRQRRRLATLHEAGTRCVLPGADCVQHSPEDDVSRGEFVRLLEQAIDALPERYRAIVVLRELEGSSVQAVAECLSITEEAARVRLHRARALLRDKLAADAGLPAGEVFPFGGPRCDRIVAQVLQRIA